MLELGRGGLVEVLVTSGKTSPRLWEAVCTTVTDECPEQCCQRPQAADRGEGEWERKSQSKAAPGPSPRLALIGRWEERDKMKGEDGTGNPWTERALTGVKGTAVNATGTSGRAGLEEGQRALGREPGAWWR